MQKLEFGLKENFKKLGFLEQSVLNLNPYDITTITFNTDTLKRK